MLETPNQVRERLIKEAESRSATRCQNATSINASDSALQDYKFALKRIHAMTEADLAKRAIEVPAADKPPHAA